MTRQEIRTYARYLIDELTESPEGLFTNDELNIFINISQRNIQLDLIQYIPWYFRKSFKISITANKRTYSIPTDCSITDFLLMEEIFLNISGKKPIPLIKVDLDQICEYVTVGEVGEPKIWSFEEKDVIAFDPIPNATLAEKYKAFYFPLIPALNDDTVHTPPTKYAIPALPESSHHLISLDVVKQCHIASEEEASDIEKRYAEELLKVAYQLSVRQGTSFEMRPNIKEYME